MSKTVSELANKGVYVGTSSWQYEGWRGMLYDLVVEASQQYAYPGTADVWRHNRADRHSVRFGFEQKCSIGLLHDHTA